MPRVETIAADTSFHASLRGGFGYPWRGAALPTCLVLALIHYVGLLPGYSGALASALVWAATRRYVDHPLRMEIDAQRQQLASPA